MATARSDRLLVLLSRWRINLAWLGLLAIPFARPTVTSTVAWLPLLAAGVALRVWARGHLVRARRLTQTGPYALVRHPLYVGSLCIAIAFAFMTRLTWLPLVVAAVFMVMYVPKALREEAYLRERLGEEYATYASRVGAFLPRMVPAWSVTVTDTRFAWARVLGHQEWKTWIGVLAMFTFLVVRAAVATRH